MNIIERVAGAAVCAVTLGIGSANAGDLVGGQRTIAVDKTQLAKILSVPHAGAGSLVESLYGTLTDVMKRADKLGFRGRLQELRPTVREAFHLNGMARVAVGEYWDGMSDDERRMVISHFEVITVAKIADQFDSYDGEKFVILDEVPGPLNTVWVRTKRIKPADAALPLNYLTKKFDDGWRIIDIQVMGFFSELKNRRSEFAAVLARQGASGLLAALERKVSVIENR